MTHTGERTMYTAYDYAAQRWVRGPEAREILVRQARETLDLLQGPRGAEYLRWTGAHETLEQAVGLLRAQLARMGAA